MKKQCFMFIFLGALLITACVGTGSANIEVKDPWARASKMGGGEGEVMMGVNGAAYMVLSNTGNVADRLISVESDASDVAELHHSEMVDGVMKMRPVEYIEVPAKGSAELKPGGLHIMLIGLTQDLVPGEKIKLHLKFETSSEIQVEAIVRVE